MLFYAPQEPQRIGNLRRLTRRRHHTCSPEYLSDTLELLELLPGTTPPEAVTSLPGESWSHYTQ
ncbi:hypothetical protein J6590_043304 [Homalodisca vitripennis]|nr:hypothetical protein J6590_043304 [Homalodisca vitripennis]